MTITVAVVDDQDLVRAGLAGLLASDPGLTVVAQGVNGLEAIEIARAHTPDVIVMDIRMPELDGLEATRRIAEDASLAGTRVLVLTTFDADEYVFAAIRAGASGFLLKDASADELIAAVKVVASGEALLSPSATRRLIERFASAPSAATAPSTLELLTEREREVLGLIGKGLSNDEIAERLVISPLTAKTHVSHIMTKLGARDRAQLVTFAYEWGVVSPGL